MNIRLKAEGRKVGRLKEKAEKGTAKSDKKLSGVRFLDYQTDKIIKSQPEKIIPAAIFFDKNRP